MEEEDPKDAYWVLDALQMRSVNFVYTSKQMVGKGRNARSTGKFSGRIGESYITFDQLPDWLQTQIRNWVRKSLSEMIRETGRR